MSTSTKLIWIAGFAGLLAGASLSTHRRLEQQRRTLRAKPEPLQTWEGEGGAVPLRTGKTAQQVTPTTAAQHHGSQFQGGQQQGFDRPSSLSGATGYDDGSPREREGGPVYQQGGPR